VAGLVCITPASGFVLPMPALYMGIIVAALCYFAVAILKARLGYDDSLDAFGVHGVGGATGALLTGVFCSVGAEASLKQFTAQAIAVLVTIVYATAVTWIIVFILKNTIGIRVSDEEEETGLDVTQHGEVGYNL
jgi:Amt family ammonium transporter